MANKLAAAIAFRQYAKTKTRKVGDAVDDPIADKLAKAQSADDMAKLAIESGIPKDVVEEKAKKAPNPGQFRMTIGNLIRGVYARVEKYHTLTGGRVDAADVGTKKLFQAKMAEYRKANRPVKDGPKPSTGKKKTETAKKGGRVAASKSGKGDAAATPKGAPSKSEAAGRGKGKKGGDGSAKKSRWQRNASNKKGKPAADAADGAGVGEQGEQEGGQSSLAEAIAEANS